MHDENSYVGISAIRRPNSACLVLSVGDEALRQQSSWNTVTYMGPYACPKSLGKQFHAFNSTAQSHFQHLTLWLVIRVMTGKGLQGIHEQSLNYEILNPTGF